MALVDSIIGAESGGATHVSFKFFAHSRIGKLLLARSPSAVLWRVITITVDSIDRMISTRPRSHVGVEIHKITAPALANLNAALAIQVIRYVGWLLATSNHSVPDLILSSGTATSGNRNRHAVCGVGQFRRLDLPASTTQSIPRIKVGRSHDNFRTAVAYTSKATNLGAAIFSNFRLCFRGRDQSTKPQPDVLLPFGH